MTPEGKRIRVTSQQIRRLLRQMKKTSQGLRNLVEKTRLEMVTERDIEMAKAIEELDLLDGEADHLWIDLQRGQPL